MFVATFLVLATCNNIYAEDNNDLKFIETACKIYNGFNPILSVIILVVVITTAVAALFGKLSMAVVVTVMVTAIVIKQAPQIVRLVTDDKPYSVHVRITATTTK